MTTLEYRSCANSEILFANVAAVVAALAACNAVAVFAGRALRALWPEPPFKILAPRLRIGEHLEQLQSAYGYFVVHYLTPLNMAKLSAFSGRESSI